MKNEKILRHIIWIVNDIKLKNLSVCQIYFKQLIKNQRLLKKKITTTNSPIIYI